MPRAAQSMVWGELAKAQERLLVARSRIGQKSAGLHNHNFHEVMHVESGRGRHEVGDGKMSELKPGDVLFIRPQDRHTMTGRRAEPLTVMTVAFSPLTGDLERAAEMPAVKDLFAFRSRYPVHWSPREDLLPEVREVFEEVTGGPRDALAAITFLCSLAQLARRHRTEANAVGSAPSWLDEAIRVTETAEGLREGVPAMVRAAGRTPEHVSREMKRCLGKGPRDLLNERRLRAAVRMLELTDTSVKEIARECGYANASHFVRSFKDAHHDPPLRYRRRRRGMV